MFGKLESDRGHEPVQRGWSDAARGGIADFHIDVSSRRIEIDLQPAINRCVRAGRGRWDESRIRIHSGERGGDGSGARPSADRRRGARDRGLSDRGHTAKTGAGGRGIESVVAIPIIAVVTHPPRG